MLEGRYPVITAKSKELWLSPLSTMRKVSLYRVRTSVFAERKPRPTEKTTKGLSSRAVNPTFATCAMSRIF